jgi:hypothetical protein
LSSGNFAPVTARIALIAGTGDTPLDQERRDFIQRLPTRKRLSGGRFGITDLHGVSLSHVG